MDARVVNGDVSDLDVIVFQKAYEQSHLAAAKSLRDSGRRIVLDICDNHFYNPAAKPQLSERATRLAQMIEIADLITVGSAAMKDVVLHPETAVIDDALELPDTLDRQLQRAGASLTRGSGRSRLLWFGTAGAHGLPFGMRDLTAALPELEGLPQIELIVVSNSREAYRKLPPAEGVRTKYFPWHRRTFPLLAGTADIAFIPVDVNPFTRVKTSNRVATSLAFQLPVITDRIPSYEHHFGDCILFGEHRRNLLRYLEDPALRARHVRTGREKVKDIYEPTRIANQWRNALQRALDV